MHVESQEVANPVRHQHAVNASLCQRIQRPLYKPQLQQLLQQQVPILKAYNSQLKCRFTA
jgi:hypothetical protein